VATFQKARLIIYLVGSTFLISFVFYFYQIIYTPNILVDGADRLFVIKSGSTYRQVLIDLDRQRLVNDMVSFSFLARLKNMDRHIQAGRYLLRRNMTNIEAINSLMGGRREAVEITFTNVRLLKDLDDRITKNIGVTPEEFQAALNKYIATNKEGFTHDNILCMFIPNTYQVYFNVVPDELVGRMNDEYKRFWNEGRRSKADSLGLSPIQVSILASIVQAETVKQDEAPIIAGLYLNRLRKKIPLQADPTLVFAVGDFTIKRVLDKHKEVESPYNTYKYAGLPPGPINMPSIANMDAVLNAADSDYLYMCAREDFSGYHNFATNLSAHNRNAARYQRALSEEIRKGRALRRAQRKTK
jgi:UPF0755 protein